MDCCSYFCIQRESYCDKTSAICTNSESCKLGCCIAELDIKHANYPREKCEKSGGIFSITNCNDDFE